MEELPKQSGVTENSPVPLQVKERKPLFEKHLLIALAVSIVILGLIFATYFLFARQRPVNQVEAIRGEVQQATFQTGKFKEYVLRDLDKAAQLDNKTQQDQQFKLYSSVFDNLLAEYNSSKNSKIREIAVSVKDFLAKNYPKLYTEDKFQLSCFEKSCGSPMQDAKLDEIKSKVQEQVSDAGIKLNIVDTFERVGWLAENQKLQKFNQLTNALNMFENYAKDDNRPEVQKTVTVFRNYLRDNFTEYWASYLAIQEAKSNRK